MWGSDARRCVSATPAARTEGEFTVPCTAATMISTLGDVTPKRPWRMVPACTDGSELASKPPCDRRLWTEAPKPAATTTKTTAAPRIHLRRRAKTMPTRSRPWAAPLVTDADRRGFGALDRCQSHPATVAYSE